MATAAELRRTLAAESEERERLRAALALATEYAFCCANGAARNTFRATVEGYEIAVTFVDMLSPRGGIVHFFGFVPYGALLWPVDAPIRRACDVDRMLALLALACEESRITAKDYAAFCKVARALSAFAAEAVCQEQHAAALRKAVLPARLSTDAPRLARPIRGQTSPPKEQGTMTSGEVLAMAEEITAQERAARARLAEIAGILYLAGWERVVIEVVASRTGKAYRLRANKSESEPFGENLTIDDRWGEAETTTRFTRRRHAGHGAAATIVGYANDGPGVVAWARQQFASLPARLSTDAPRATRGLSAGKRAQRRNPVNHFKGVKRQIRRVCRALDRQPQYQEAYLLALRDEHDRLWEIYTKVSDAALRARDAYHAGEISAEARDAAWAAYEDACEDQRRSGVDHRGAVRDLRELRETLSDLCEARMLCRMDEQSRYEYHHDL